MAGTGVSRVIDRDALSIISASQAGALFGETPERRIDTHAATIFLTRDRAWKLKRPVRFDYLDFSTAPLRHAALTAELALNQALAPALYRQVHAITRAPDGTLRLGGAGEAVDWVLEMGRFADGALFSEMAARGCLDTGLLVRLVDRIVAFHGIAPADHSETGATRLAAIIAGNMRCMMQFPEILPAAAVAQLDRQLGKLTSSVAPLLDARERAGRVRHGHGDLHLRNIAIIDGEPTPFDRLEFSTALAIGDVLYDLAFLAMDLWQSGLRAEANLVCNRYLDRSPADEAGSVLMPLFMAVRASIRAHVTAMLAAQDSHAADAAEARRYLDLALDCLRPAPLRLVAIGGASGTGKSAFARAIADRLGKVPGARILRTDLLRKRAAGVAPEMRLDAASYTPQSAATVQADLRSATLAALTAGQSVIADATFLDDHARAAIADVATQAGARFDGLWLWAPEAVRVARVGARQGDVSDADAAVARAQSPSAAPPPNWHALRAEGPLEEVVVAGLAALEAPPQAPRT